MSVDVDTLADVAILVVWFLFVFVGPKIFSKKKKEIPEREYPEFPDHEKTSDKTVDVSEEERKLKEWLENVFGAGKKTPAPVPPIETGRTEAEYEDENDEKEPYYNKEHIPTPVCVQVVSSLTGKEECFASVKERELLPVVRPNRQIRLNRKQLAYSVVMAEILGKPRSLQRRRYNFPANML
jgi:hypothetical protein